MVINKIKRDDSVFKIAIEGVEVVVVVVVVVTGSNLITPQQIG